MKKKVTQKDYNKAQDIIDTYNYYIHRYISNKIIPYLADILNITKDSIDITNYEDYYQFNCVEYDISTHIIATFKLPMNIIYNDIDNDTETYKLIKIDYEDNN